MKRIIDRVTLTGANNTTDPYDLVTLTNDFPFVEWGILLSKASMGQAPRFPGRAWLAKMAAVQAKHGLHLSGHLCGRWVRDVCKGEWSFMEDLGPGICEMFERIQLNFHAEVHKIAPHAFNDGFVHPYADDREFIFQLDDVNDKILEIARISGVTASPLFDLSGGAGVLPKHWPKADGYCGYAGGLSPSNVADQMARIQEAAGDGPIWIDAETHVRSDNDKIFDLEKVRRFLEAALPWVKPGVMKETEDE